MLEFILNFDLVIWSSGTAKYQFLIVFFIAGGTYEKRNGMKEPDHFGETVSDITNLFIFPVYTAQIIVKSYLIDLIKRI